MAIICNGDNRKLTLSSYSRFGRDSGGIVIDQSRTISRFHAEIRFSADGWWIKDLNSRNGTYVDGRRLSATAVELTAGTKIRFGESEITWTLVDTKSPKARAYKGDRCVVEGEERVLGLPNEQDPRVTIMAGTTGWEAETPEGAVRVSDGAELALDDGVYRLELPTLLVNSSTTTGSVTPSLHSLALHFKKDAPDEYAQITGARGRVSFNLGRRAHHDLLLHLAQVRVQEQSQGIPEPEAGWVFISDLRNTLGKDETVVNLHIYRARQALHAAGIPNGNDIVQRRQGTGQIRIGSRHLVLADLPS